MTPRPSFHITILAADEVTEIDVAVYTEPFDAGVGERRQFDVWAVEPGRVLTPGEETRALFAAWSWRPW